MSEVLMNKDEIKKVIPHREPMLMIDSILSMEEGEQIRSSFYLDPELDFFRGHFPGEPAARLQHHLHQRGLYRKRRAQQF